MDLVGCIVDIMETKSFGVNNFLVREFVIQTEEQYPQEICLQFVQDKTMLLDDFSLNQRVKVNFNLKGKKWVNNVGESKYFNTLEAWKINLI